MICVGTNSNTVLVTTLIQNIRAHDVYKTYTCTVQQ